MGDYFKGFKKLFNKNNLIIGIFILALILIIFGYSSNNSEKIQTNFQQACINETCFNLEIADTNEERQKGLSNRNSLAEDSGMLFIFQEKTIPGFWMKDMGFPLDIIWINPDMEISGIVKGIEPCTPDFCPVVFPSEEIAYVLEVNAGLSDLYGFEIGDVVKLE